MVFKNLCILVLWDEIGLSIGRVKNAWPEKRFQNFSARPDLATNILQTLVPTTYNSLVSKRAMFPSAMS